MRSFKKAAAVVLTAVMTMAMGVSAFASDTVTFHFQNSKNWDPTGAWVYEGIAFTTNITPADKSKVITHEAEGDKIVWPGAVMDDDTKEGWKSIQVTAEDVASNGLVAIFNNYVADSELNDTTTQADLDSIAAAGIPTTATATKEQTPNVLINKKMIKALSGSLTDVYVEFDGTNVTVSLNDAPSAYTSAADVASAATETEAATTAATATATTKASTGVKSNTSSPKTGDSVAVSVVLFGLASAVAFVAANKKKVNA